MKKLLIILLLLPLFAVAQLPYSPMYILAGQQSVIDPDNPGKTDLIAYYSLDETTGLTAFDLHGDHNGTNTGATINQTGKVDKCYYFTNTTDFVDLGVYSDLFDNSNVFISVSAWVKLGNLNNHQYVFAKYTNIDGGRRRSFYFNVTSSGELRTFIGDNTSAYRFYVTNSSGLITLNQWHHIVVSVDLTNEIILFWVDGVSYESSVVSSGGRRTTLFSSDTSAKIGRIQDSDASYNGLDDSYVDELIIWGKTLTHGNAGYLYNSGDGRSYSDL